MSARVAPEKGNRYPVWMGWKGFFDNVHFIIIKGRRPGMESVLSRKQHWALGRAVRRTHMQEIIVDNFAGGGGLYWH